MPRSVGEIPGRWRRFRAARASCCVLVGLASAAALGCSEASSAGGAAGSSAGRGGSGGQVGVAGAGGSPSGSSGSAGTAGGAGSSSSGDGAGSAGRSAADAGLNGGALCPSGTLFCADFEGDNVGQIPGSPWQQSVNGGTVNVDGTHAFSGSKSVLAIAPTGANYRRAYFALQNGSAIFPAAARAMYGRVMLWLEAAPREVHWTMIQGEGLAADGSHNALYRYGGQHDTGRLMANYETTQLSTDCYKHAQNTFMPTGKWACAEWHFVVASNEMQFWLDGSEVTDLHVIDRGEGCGGNDLNGEWLAPPAFQSVYLGWEQYQPWQNDIRVWVDDVAISSERVGCPAPPGSAR